MATFSLFTFRQLHVRNFQAETLIAQQKKKLKDFAINLKLSLITTMNRCKVCKKDYKSKIALTKHIRRVHTDRIYTCAHCAKSYKAKDILSRHLREIHFNDPIEKFQCSCGKAFQNKNALRNHKTRSCKSKEPSKN